MVYQRRKLLPLAKFITVVMLYLIVLVKFILSDIYVEAISELLVLHGISRHHRRVAAFVSWGGGQLIIMV